MLTDQSVLIVEDNVYVALDLCAAVEEMNGRVVGPASSVADALTLLDSAHVSAAILDCHLEDSEATQVASRLVEKNIPYVLHTGTPVSADLTALRPGAPVLTKPVKPKHVVEALARHAEKATPGKMNPILY